MRSDPFTTSGCVVAGADAEAEGSDGEVGRGQEAAETGSR